MSHGLKRLRGRDIGGSIAQLNRTQYDAAVKTVNEQRPAPLPKVMVPATHPNAAQLVQQGVRTAVQCMHDDCRRLHAQAKGKVRDRLYGELLGYDAVLKLLKNNVEVV